MQRHQRFAWTWAAAGVFMAGAAWSGSTPRGTRGTHAAAGFALPPGAPPVSFSAWGATGTETLTLLVRMGVTPGGFELKWKEVPLTREPKQDTIGRSRVADGKVVGGAVTPIVPTRLNGA